MTKCEICVGLNSGLVYSEILLPPSTSDVYSAHIFAIVMLLSNGCLNVVCYESVLLLYPYLINFKT